ncbi:MAG TPA: hypothetical protein VJQ81_04915 [Reyranella sp.]|jgi:hypothetical protein|nr:hypothetical protein [Reyranella sp.]
MMSALECFTKSAHCEELARACQEPSNRITLLKTAQLWRELGQASKAAEARRAPFLATSFLRHVR